ncbi:hypothetical protein [Phenylobacterium ferrooxidans]|uniref:Uncharacterized protein n=1 Tax=Phenylobacterium ferrooxidans TaxID=2982689 RepID=A0ABW6CPF5_9CAUL
MGYQTRNDEDVFLEDFRPDNDGVGREWITDVQSEMAQFTVVRELGPPGVYPSAFHPEAFQAEAEVRDEACDAIWRDLGESPKTVEARYLRAWEGLVLEERSMLQPMSVPDLLAAAKCPSWTLAEAPAVLLGWRPTPELLGWAIANAPVSRPAEELNLLASELWQAFQAGEFNHALVEEPLAKSDAGPPFESANGGYLIRPDVLALWAWEHGFFVHRLVRRYLLAPDYEYSHQALRAAIGKVGRLEKRAKDAENKAKSAGKRDWEKHILVFSVILRALESSNKKLSVEAVRGQLDLQGGDVSAQVIKNYFNEAREAMKVLRQKTEQEHASRPLR